MKRFLLCVAAGVVAAFILIALTVLANAQRPIPRCGKGQCMDDAIGIDREGQPQWCQNKTERGYEANCKCTRACTSNSRSANCMTTCRTAACRCDHGCPMTSSVEPKGLCEPVGSYLLYGGTLYSCNGLWKVAQLRLIKRY